MTTVREIIARHGFTWEDVPVDKDLSRCGPYCQHGHVEEVGQLPFPRDWATFKNTCRLVRDREAYPMLALAKVLLEVERGESANSLIDADLTWVACPYRSEKARHESGLSIDDALEKIILLKLERTQDAALRGWREAEALYLVRSDRAATWWRRMSRALYGIGDKTVVVAPEAAFYDCTHMETVSEKLILTRPETVRVQGSPVLETQRITRGDLGETLETAAVLAREMSLADALEAARNLT